MGKKQKEKTLESLCKHYRTDMVLCPHIQPDGRCSQRKVRPKVCLAKFPVKENSKEIISDSVETEDDYVYFS